MPSRRALAGCCLALILLSAGTARGAQAPPVTEATLDNGLRILILEDHRNPIATVQTWYRVGARNEIPGATGLAHFLEHMMFKGTPTYGKGQLAQVVEENGGQDNAFTSHDVTTYYVNIAADRVDLVLGLEADRMRNLLLDPQEIESERQVVAEERRSRIEDDPDGYLSEEFLAAAYKAHPYGWPVIGWMSDIQRINAAELRAFYDRYYVPGNALLVVAGDVDPPRVIARARETFGKLARGAAPPPMNSVEPPQVGERRVLVYKPDARAAIVYIGFHVPNYASADAPALELLSTILQEGRASRLYRRLVYERRLDRVHGGWGGAAGELAEGLAGAGDHALRIHVACHDEQGVVGHVVAVVEDAQLGGIDALDVAHPPDHRPAIGMRLVGGGEELLGEIAIGIVLDAAPPLLRHHLPLGLDLLGIEEEVAHPVRLQPQDEVDAVGRDVHVV